MDVAEVFRVHARRERRGAQEHHGDLSALGRSVLSRRGGCQSKVLLRESARASCSDTACVFLIARRTTSPSVNLSFAFLDPVKGSDIAAESIARLRQFDIAIAQSYAIDGETCVFNAYPPARDTTRNMPRLVRCGLLAN
jgi:hypothetical protein